MERGGLNRPYLLSLQVLLDGSQALVRGSLGAETRSSHPRNQPRKPVPVSTTPPCRGASLNEKRLTYLRQRRRLVTIHPFQSMKNRVVSLTVITLTAITTLCSAKNITVNTEDNTDFGVGKTNLVRAISLLADGDTIQFNISNTTTNKHYLVTPPRLPNNGYPPITNHNVTIDGYSQPGATPNTNPILAANNAQIRIVLDSRGDAVTMEDIAGYGTSESATLFVMGATNVHIRGVCLLGPGPTVGGDTDGSDADPSRYGISFALGAHYGHVSGCRIGLDLDNTSVYRYKDCITVFGGGAAASSRTSIGVKPGPADVAGARAQFNVFIGGFIPLIFEGGTNFNISGNFINVFPNGVTDYASDGTPPHNLESMMEFGGSINTVIGTDGDGNNDAEERNIFGGVTMANDDNIHEFYGGGGVGLVIAGNYYGVGIDGTTRFTNSMNIVDNFKNTATARFGSDFDGVSDAIEGNVIYMNNPFSVLFPNGTGVPPSFSAFQSGAKVSVRGNKMVNNNVAPFSYANNTGGFLSAFTNYEAPNMSIEADIIPGLSTNSTVADIIGTCALTNGGPLSNIIVDVYILDPEGWTNGKLFSFAELSDQSTYTNGFPQGKTYLGSFLDNGPYDRNPAVAGFNFGAGALGIASGTDVTVTANYSASPPGVHNAVTHTSNFSNPVTLRAALRITSFSRTGNTLTINWTGGTGPYTLQKQNPVTGAWGNVTTGIAGTSTTDTIVGTQSYYRVIGH
jgi:hypothetical protein